MANTRQLYLASNSNRILVLGDKATTKYNYQLPEPTNSLASDGMTPFRLDDFCRR